MRVNQTIYLSIGTNIENRIKNIETAIEHLKKILSIEKESSIYETEPVGYKNQANFLNLVIKAKTKNSPTRLLQKLKSIEKKMGRIKKFKDGPRVIDLDILFYEKKIIEIDYLTIPHSELHKRNFVLKPLAEIEPRLIHPKFKVDIKTLLSKLKKPEKVTLYNE